MRQPLLLLLSAALLAACGDAPRPVTSTAPQQPSGQLPAGHPEIGQPSLPEGHPPMGGMGGAGGEGMIMDARVSGRLVLTGALAEAEGFVLVSVRPKGMPMPLLSYKIDLADADATVDGEGRRVVPFRLDPGSTMMPFSGIPEGLELEVQARYDPDGFVETKEGVVTAVAPVQPVAEDVELVLGG